MSISGLRRSSNGIALVEFESRFSNPSWPRTSIISAKAVMPSGLAPSETFGDSWRLSEP